MKTDRWLNVMLEARQLSRHRLTEKSPLDVKREGESLLLAGTQYGYLVLLDPSDGSVKYSVRAHGSAVSLIRCNPKRNQIITASQGRHLLHYTCMYVYVHTMQSLSCTRYTFHALALYLQYYVHTCTQCVILSS